MVDIRYSTGKEAFSRMNTEELRKEFLVKDIFRADDISCVYSHIDRIVVLGAMPVSKSVDLQKNIDPMKDFGVDYLLQRRELGIINIGGNGKVIADGKSFDIIHFDGLYIGAGTKSVQFTSDDPANPAKFYMTSAPAHCTYPTKHIKFAESKHVPAGKAEDSNLRTINQYIHPDVLDTCQLSMGLTHLEPGSVWNTMPAHTHERRMEVYFYFEIPENQVVFHFMGEPSETRHIVMQNDEAVINPSWSIHSGAGTSNYTFIWAMCGENRTYTDQDWLNTADLR
ncbi:MAG: 5-dehydro-4-deoxy-D-glucuronate isomerase [Treponema sp.]|nr:5-dehydro-4-deoxy-D-glucuronate isomerase [Spirochaetia bacterium]MDD6296108.1 5-dehydro-4-deoxy-D-glucuronate isomerase [Treponema sp.]MDD7451192.1 5-dehydro-4-deoxy-D-glucuronate isomerase [Treponema sp.]MDY2924993.1 5-dehydro-4-deoxy-D-glucuronate isomerase [Treponema sp.]MDY3722246.1 5-dehydro-4-deoxy-D-glucuronate isomerase [Treponema sp.]